MGVTTNENGASFWGDKNVVMTAHHVFTKKQNTELHFWIGRFSAMWIYSIKMLKKQLRLRFSFFAKVTKYEGGRTGKISQPPVLSNTIAATIYQASTMCWTFYALI